MNWKLYEPEAGGFAPAKLQPNSKIPKKTISNNTVKKVFVPLTMICKDASIEYGWGATFNPFYGFKRRPEKDSYENLFPFSLDEQHKIIQTAPDHWKPYFDMAKLWQKFLKTRKKAQLGGAEPFSNLLLSFWFLMMRQAGFESSYKADFAGAQPAAYGFVDQDSLSSKSYNYMQSILFHFFN